ncbi:transglutaminase family protein [Croceicoccus naphthovorans]|uniref:Transglutaminase n=1 Tax=Croceicoccus naphthovorans TaxID=1348774 RepID=A0A0G3XCR7_9SPHN|nr:transglutaminase family protein [Croceicoccus naphthovorans]AKM09350.1 transglutaminase [Croceicoccus naphthovorans]MBB3990265.1 transglutaminase-like putative cysteine protease [Croceicoccus naphthovorans]
MRLAITHRTRYDFEDPVVHALQRLRLTPKSTSGQSIAEWKMELTGAARELEYEDHNCNLTTLVAVEPGVQKVEIECKGIIDTNDNGGVIGRHAGHLPLWHFASQTKLTKPGAGMRALVQGLSAEQNPLDTMHELSARVLDAVTYETGRTDSDTTAEEAMGAGHGVCQDHAHIFIGCARQLGVPARYVSGYLMMDDRVSQEAGHAWAEAHIGGLGWVGFDISNGISPDARYVRVATGCDYAEAAPITGISFGSHSDRLSVELEVAQQTADQ